MENFIRTKMIYFLFICLISLSQSSIKIKLQSEITEDELYPMEIKYDYICQTWMPSLFNPFLIISDSTIENYGLVFKKKISLSNLYFQGISFKCDVSELFFKSQYTTYVAQCAFTNNANHGNCFFGLSHSVPKSTIGLDINDTNIDILNQKKYIDEKIFSFSKWQINDDLVTSELLIGDSHLNYKDSGYIGICNVTDESYWRCDFENLTFYDYTIPLRKDDKTLYQIYLTTESNTISFPSEFKTILKTASKEKCKSTLFGGDYFLDCENADNVDYIPLKISTSEMNITAEIDFFDRFRQKTKGPKTKTRIQFSHEEYIIFPMMMFKQFDVEFNAEKKAISFFTTNSSILETPIPPVKKSNVLKILLIILIIIIVLAAGFGIFLLIRYFKRRRGTSLEYKISACNKYEDDFNSINQNTN